MAVGAMACAGAWNCRVATFLAIQRRLHVTWLRCVRDHSSPVAWYDPSWRCWPRTKIGSGILFSRPQRCGDACTFQQPCLMETSDFLGFSEVLLIARAVPRRQMIFLDRRFAFYARLSSCGVHCTWSRCLSQQRPALKSKLFDCQTLLAALHLASLDLLPSSSYDRPTLAAS